MRRATYLLLAVTLAAPLSAQEEDSRGEPTPFWLPTEPEPAKKKPGKPAPAKVKAPAPAKKKAPAKPKAVQRPARPPSSSEPEADYQFLEPPARATGPRPERDSAVPRAGAGAAEAAEPGAPAAAPAPRRREPLPPIPRLEPQVVPQRPVTPGPVPPGPGSPGPSQAPAPAAPSAEPTAPAAAALVAPPLVIPERRAAPPPREAPAASALRPSAMVDGSRTSVGPPAFSSTRRRWSLLALGGFWAKTRSDGVARQWQLTYGLSASWDLLPNALQLNLLATRGGSSSGNRVTSASATHTLVALRAFGVFGGNRLAALVGGGVGLTLAQTRYALQVDDTPRALSAASGRLTFQATAGVRWRVWRGLEARAEVSSLLRDGRLDVLPLLGLGWAF